MNARVLAVCLFYVAACGDNGGKDNEPGPSQATLLTCESHVYCTTWDVRRYAQPLPAPKGGKLEDGLYRLAYTLEPEGRTDADSMPWAMRDSAEAIRIAGGQFYRLGVGVGTGTYATDPGSPSITFTYSAGCTDWGTATTSTPQPRSNPYTFEEGKLTLFYEVSRGNETWQRAHVFIPVERLCTLGEAVDSPTPQDSYACRVRNCGCLESQNRAVEMERCDFTFL
jgi:hypothetical protein